jgi:NhaA family Na+:H+ antiporter
MKKNIKLIYNFINLETSSSLFLFIATAIALFFANSPWQNNYNAFLHYTFSITLNHIHSTVSVHHFINDGLMTLFFLLVSLEVKRELLIGEISSKEKGLLPVLGAIGGMLVPALIYCSLNYLHPQDLRGWAIPTATDIAFSLAILVMIRKYIPSSLKIFLTALAIIDDIGAIIIIALFYTTQLHIIYLWLAFCCLLALSLLNFSNVRKILPYAIIGLILWFCIIQSGIHATIAGILLGFFIPLKIQRDTKTYSPLQKLEKRLHPYVAFGILPLFALANAGLSLTQITTKEIFSPITIGIAAGLFIGKQFGVFSACWLAIKLRLAKLPADMQWRHLYGVSILCGIGFTMSLFIGNLAFETETHYSSLIKLGVLSGSLLSAIFGYCIFRVNNSLQNSKKTIL